ncbi:MAG TPA: hypothetical protein VGI30_02525 [Caulobacteraceae bacterium]
MTLRTILLAIGGIVAAPAAQAAIHQYSYDPADAATRQAAGGVTFMVNKTLFGGTRVLKMRATEAKATADLQRADPGVLGRGGLTRILGPEGPAHDLYRIESADEGPSFVAALCPGSKRGWVALSPVRYGQDMQAVVLGDDPAGGPARACRKLAFTFRGEWRLPSGTPPPTEAVEAPAFPN